MRALVVYESMFGNTRAVAEAIAAGLSMHMPVDSVEVGVAPDRLDDAVTLIVIGGPTHAFGLSRPNTRRDASTRGDRPIISSRRGLREWLGGLATSDHSVGFATFDTRIRRPRLPGSAARAAEKRLRKLALRRVAPAESFWVGGTTGPMLPGEIGRARAWGDRVGSAVARSPRSPSVPASRDLRL